MTKLYTFTLGNLFHFLCISMKLETKETESKKPHDTGVDGVDSAAEGAGFPPQVASFLLCEQGVLRVTLVPQETSVSSSMEREARTELA